MKRRELSLILLLAVGVALWLARGWWLPEILALFPRIEKQADLIQTLEALIGIGGVVLNAILAYLLWLSRQPKSAQAGQQIELLKPITPQEIKPPGPGSRVNWIDRRATGVDDLRAHDRLVIAGRMGLGKTREAAELIRLAVAEGLVSQDQLYVLGRDFRSQSAESLPGLLRRSFDVWMPLLLFVDDLPRHFHDAGLDLLAQALGVLRRECKAAYVVATARDTQLTQAHETWLEQQGFYPLKLRGLDTEETGRLVDAAAGVFDLQVGNVARDEFMAKGDGTPGRTLMGLSRLRRSQQGTIQVDQDMAQRAAHESMSAAWAQTRREIESQVPATRPLLGALSIFYAAEADAYTPMVLRYAAGLWKGHKRQPWRRMPALRQALAYLLTHSYIAERGGQISHLDVVVEGNITPQKARERLGAFLEHHRRLFHRRGLRRLYPDARPHSWALFDLAKNAEQRGDRQAAIHFYCAALEVRPDSGLCIIRGNAYSEMGNYERAITDYDEAIRRNPENASAYYFRGNTYAEMGDYERAIADCDEAIRLNPENANVYYFRGNTYAEMGDNERAIVDYDEAIRLNPEDASTYYATRGSTYFRQDDNERAIADYDEAIRRNPEDAAAYSSRGLTFLRQGDYKRAIADFDEAIRRNPEDASAYHFRGNTYAKMGNYERAIADYDEAIRRNPEYAAAAYYDAACTFGLQENVEFALLFLRRALELDPTQHLTLIPSDSDFDPIRDDPQFQALLAEFAD